jgi:hypothetical protein
MGLLAACLLIAVTMAWGEASANEKAGMPSERKALQERYAGSGAATETVARVESIRTHEDRLFLNGEPYILKRATRFEDEDGVRIGLEDIPLGAQLEVEYRTGSGLEESGYGPDMKILTKVRIVQPPPRKQPVP